MTNRPLVAKQTLPPIIDLHRFTTHTALWLGLWLVAWAERAAHRRRARTSPQRVLVTAELERLLDQVHLDRSKWLTHFRQGL